MQKIRECFESGGSHALEMAAVENQGYFASRALKRQEEFKEATYKQPEPKNATCAQKAT